jgi:hypothetical protein
MCVSSKILHVKINSFVFATIPNMMDVLFVYAMDKNVEIIKSDIWLEFKSPLLHLCKFQWLLLFRLFKK